jgi:hypothetical protein
MLYAEPALAFSTAGSGSASDRPASSHRNRDRDARQERWPARLSWADLVATTESEWHRRQAPKSSDAGSRSGASSSEALFCRFEVDNVFDR